jgi:3-mercaptopyruvate sulfurtransferase SseA
MKPIITPSELKNLPTENLIILDARVGKEVYQNYLNKHIKGARFIDLDKDLADIGKMLLLEDILFRLLKNLQKHFLILEF